MNGGEELQNLNIRKYFKRKSKDVQDILIKIIEDSLLCLYNQELIEDKTLHRVISFYFLLINYDYYGQTNSLAMSHAYQLNIYSTVALKNVDVLRLFSECQGTFKGYFAYIKYYRDQDGFIFPATYNYSQYESAKSSDQGGGSGGFR